MFSVVTKLVASLEFLPIRCATTPFHFGRTRNVYVATRIILLSGIAESGATSGYGVVTESSGQSEAWASRNVERARKKLSFVPNSGLIDAACNMSLFSIIVFFSYFKIFFHFILAFFPCMKIFLVFVYVFIYCVGAGITTLMPISDGPDPYSSVEGWKRGCPSRKKWTEGCLFPARVGIFSFDKYYD